MTNKKKIGEKSFFVAMKLYAVLFLLIPISFLFFVFLNQFERPNIDPAYFGKGSLSERSLSKPFVCQARFQGLGEGYGHESYCDLSGLIKDFVRPESVFTLMVFSWIYFLAGFIVVPVMTYVLEGDMKVEKK